MPIPTAYHIVLAEDEPLLLFLFTRMVQHCYPTAHIHTAVHGRFALQAYYEHGADLLLTDHHMPQMNGATLIRTLRDHGVAIPIIGYSIDPRNAGLLQRAGATSHLVSPFTLSELQSCLAVLLPT